MNDWPALVASLRVGGALPISMFISGDRLRVEMTVPDTQTGEDIAIHRWWDLPRIHEDDMRRRKQFLRECVWWFYRHEADEQIMFDGIREFYPDGEHA